MLNFQEMLKHLIITGDNMGLGSWVKKAAGAVTGTAEDLLDSGVKHTVGAVKTTLVNPTKFAVKATTSLLRGDTQGVKNSAKGYIKDQVRDVTAQGINAINTGAKAGAAYYSMGQYRPGDIIKGDSTMYSEEKAAANEKAAALSEQQRLDAEEAARPEKERNDLFNKMYSNSLLRQGNRGYNTLLGGGY
jgi:hypothetical protein